MRSSKSWMNPASRSLMITAHVVCGEYTSAIPFCTWLFSTVSATSSVRSTNSAQRVVAKLWFSNTIFMRPTLPADGVRGDRELRSDATIVYEK